MICEFRIRVFLYIAAMLLLCFPAEAQKKVVLRTTSREVTDSLFLRDSHTVIFRVNRAEISRASKLELSRTLVPEMKRHAVEGVFIGRAAASPEGPYEVNSRLAVSRLNAIKNYLESLGIESTKIHFDTLVEDYPLLVEMMRVEKDPDYEKARNLLESANGDMMLVRARFRTEKDLWNRLKKQYFPDLRAVRVLVFWEKPDLDIHPVPFTFQHPVPEDREIRVPLPPVYRYDTLETEPRREFLSLKTNLPMWGTVIPQYGGWCPLPNVSVEYYPAHGHFTYGFTYDNPWWIGNTTNHKYFEVRHYQAEARYYFRDSDKAYEEGGAAFQKWFLSAYADAGLYQVGFSDKKGWIGEGGGAGLGGGYVLPLSRRNQHWRLELSAQFGVFITKYDPFVYGCPIDGVDDGLYYYNWTGKKELFRKRMHRFTWFGPTRVGITLSYDLLYRNNHKKGVSFRSKEQKGDVR